MEQALAAFRQFLTAEKRASEHTVRAYLHDLGEFREHAVATLGRAPALDELDVIMCRSYLASLHGKNDAVTIGRKLSSLRAFFRLAVRRRLCKSSPVAALRAPKRAKRLPSFLGKEDVGRLLDGGARSDDAGMDACGRALELALFEVIYGAGLRVSEACNLDVGDVETDGSGAMVRVRQGKGRKDRIVPIGSKAQQATDAYLQRRADRLAGTPAADRHALFLSVRGRRLGPRRAPAARPPRARLGDTARLAARAPPQLRDPSPRRGGRPARDPGDARPRQSAHDAALRARRHRPPDGRLRQEPPARQKPTMRHKQ
jgi:integrase/recombinase XerC